MSNDILEAMNSTAIGRETLRAFDTMRQSTDEPKYRIQADANSWNICERRIAGKDSKAVAPGTVTYTAIKYFANVEQAATCLIQICAREHLGDAVGHDAIIYAIEQGSRDVLKAIALIGKEPL